MVCLLKPCKVSHSSLSWWQAGNATGLPKHGGFQLLIWCFLTTLYSEEEGVWDDGGCETQRNGSTVTCHCNHLTHFALLLSPGIEVWLYGCMNIGLQWVYLTPSDWRGSDDISTDHWCSGRQYLSCGSSPYNLHFCSLQVQSASIYHVKLWLYCYGYRSLWSMRNYIHIQLCACLFVAQLLFVAGIEPRGSEVRYMWC